MSATLERTSPSNAAPQARRTDMKLEVVTLPVSDVERAKRFYESLGWRLDADFDKGDFRAMQFTPPGSSCSFHIGRGITPAAPGSAGNLFLAVSDIEAAREDLLRRGVEVSEVFHRAPGEAPAKGRHPQGATYASYAAFSDPDGNGWLLQEVTSRLPGRVDPLETRFSSPADLAAALRRAAEAHGAHEVRLGVKYDVNWPDWYADYLFGERSGGTKPA
jgi:catechol 2,3-dioxygenase-like lactoylglutathione lyase family enzyme